MVTDKKKSNISFIYCFIIVFGILIFYFPMKFNHNNSIYAIGQLHEYDEMLYLNNPTLVTGEVIPRGALNNLVALFMRFFHMEWESVIYVFLYLGLVIKAVAVVNLSSRISNKNYGVLAIVFALLLGKAAEMGMASFGNLSQSMGSGQGYSFALLALSFVIGKKKNWGVAWGFSILAALCHIHEGIYSGGIICFLWLFETIRKKQIQKREMGGLLIWMLVIIGCALPSLITASAEISDELFVYIYAIFRTPHHLVPSNYGLGEIFKYFLLLLYPAVFCLYINRGEKDIQDEKYKIGICIALWTCALTFTWIFTEIIPVSIFVSLMIPKVFKYISVLSLVGYLKTVEKLINNKKWIEALIVILFSIVVPFVSLKIGLIIFAVLLGGWLVLAEKVKYKCLYNMGVCLSLLVLVKEIPLLVLVFALLILKLQDNKAYGWVACTILALGILIGSSYNKLWTNEGGVRGITAKDYLLASVPEEVYNLALDFKSKTDKGDVFIGDPDRAYIDWFQVISRRSAWVTWKNIPSSKGAMYIWYQRYTDLGEWSSFTDVELYSLMKSNEIDYILVKEEFGLYEESAFFKEFITSTNGTYKIYTIVD